MASFREKVYLTVRRIPRGRVAAYAAVAREAGRPRAFRAVGNILNANPTIKNIGISKYRSVKVPCHRVVRSDGRVGGYVYGTKAKTKLLRSEGIKITGNRVDPKNILSVISK